MIPPVPPNLLASNPGFENLHAQLVKTLDPDSSTRVSNSNDVALKLEAHRIDSARDELLQMALRDLAYNSTTIPTTNNNKNNGGEENTGMLPRELHDLVLIVTAYISEARNIGLSREEHELLHQDINSFNDGHGHDYIPDIARLLDKVLIKHYTALSKVIAASQDAVFESNIPSGVGLGIGSASTAAGTRLGNDVSSARTNTLPRQHINNLPDQQAIPSLSTLITAQTTHLSHLRHTLLPQTLTTTINTLITLLQSQTQHMALMIRDLEQRRHGTDARYLSAKAAFLKTVAEGLELKQTVLVLEERRDAMSAEGEGSEMRERLERRMKELDEEDEKLEQRKEALTGLLGEYEAAGLDVMKALGARYTEIEKKLGDVKDDVEKLSGKD